MIYNNIEAEPYFMSNKEWYEIKVNEKTLEVRISLTDKAPKKAIESYNNDYKKNGGK